MEELIPPNSDFLDDADQGIAKCECCGCEGRRFDFYSTKKRFCSKRCAHSFSARHRKGYRKKLENCELMPGVVRTEQSFNLSHSIMKKRRICHTRCCITGQKVPELALSSDQIKFKDLTEGFSWGPYLEKTNSIAAPVECFVHAPMKKLMEAMDVNFKLEIPNVDCPIDGNVYWVVNIMKIAGYKVKVRYEGMDKDDSLDIWLNLFTNEVQNVGCSAQRNIPLIPPFSVQNNQENWKDFLYTRLNGANTLPMDFRCMLAEGIKGGLELGMRLEIMDKLRLARNRIGIVSSTLSGRLKVKYEDSNDNDDIFWCHEKSTVVHPIGWSESVGHHLYVKPGLKNSYESRSGFVNAPPESLYQPPNVKVEYPEHEEVKEFCVGMKLEAIDPLKLSNICVATVSRTLKGGYLMISIDGADDVGENKCFCHHRTSESIFPAAFCESHGIKLTPPEGWKRRSFEWKEYLMETGSSAAPAHLFTKPDKTHRFEAGMKLEAVDLMEPQLICVSTITRVIGNLLRVSFDGWQEEYDQWISARSPNIFPVGWCELVGHVLQPPNTPEDNNDNHHHHDLLHEDQRNAREYVENLCPTIRKRKNAKSARQARSRLSDINSEAYMSSTPKPPSPSPPTIKNSPVEENEVNHNDDISMTNHDDYEDEETDTANETDVRTRLDFNDDDDDDYEMQNSPSCQ